MMYQKVTRAVKPLQCSKLRFYFVRPSGAFILKLCAQDFPCALLLYIGIIIE